MANDAFVLSYNGDQVVSDMHASVEWALGEQLAEAATRARAYAPVSDNDEAGHVHLRDTITYFVQTLPNKTVVGGFGSPKRYTVFVEIGTRYMEGRYFLRRAANEVLPGMSARVRDRFEATHK